ncbi:MAG TPA: TonB-dependent siderophore receptor [Allosphingosinicella sp.]
MHLRTPSLAVLACALAAPLPAAAAPAEAASAPLAAAADGEEQSGEVIVVTGARPGYGAETTRSATRTDTPLRDVPQSLSIVSERQIDDQAMRSVADVLRYVPGVMVGQGEGHRDQITLRGNSSTADFFLDGLRDDIQYYRPLYNLQRVEVLRGPNAMIFGRGGGGGVINRVTEIPLLDRARTEGALSASSLGAWSAEADLNQPFGPRAGLRLNAVYEEFGSHRDFYDGRLIAANPTLRVLPSANSGFIFSYEYVDDERVVDRGIPSENGRPLAGHRDTFFGARGVNRTDFAGHILRGTFEHRFGERLSLVSRILFADYDKSYRNAFAATAVRTTNGVREVGIEAYEDSFQRENLFSQTDLVWSVDTGPASHTFLAGVEIGRQDTGNQRLNGLFGPNARRVFVPLAREIAVPAFVFTPGAANGERSTVSDTDLFAVYLQDQVEIGPVELIAGLRYDRFEIEVDDLVSGVATARTDDLWSPRLGLIVHPLEDVSLYASYGRSFLPQSGDQFNSLDVTGAALEPERFDNYEIGVKWQPRETFLLSAAAYRLDRANTRAPGATPGTIVQTGEQRSRGIELEATGQIRPNWSLSAGYTLQEAEIRRTTAAAPAGRDVAQVPRHLAFAWTRYDFRPGIGAGLGVTHQSRSFASISNAVVLPAFTRVDAALYWRLADGVEAQLNAENLLGATYFPTAHNDNNITTGAPRSVRGTVRFSF